jgi:hypothetical protein
MPCKFYIRLLAITQKVFYPMFFGVKFFNLVKKRGLVKGSKDLEASNLNNLSQIDGQK